jgi:hypothetical protein
LSLRDFGIARPEYHRATGTQETTVSRLAIRGFATVSLVRLFRHFLRFTPVQFRPLLHAIRAASQHAWLSILEILPDNGQQFYDASSNGRTTRLRGVYERLRTFTNVYERLRTCKHTLTSILDEREFSAGSRNLVLLSFSLRQTCSHTRISFTRFPPILSAGSET